MYCTLEKHSFSPSRSPDPKSWNAVYVDNCRADLFIIISKYLVISWPSILLTSSMFVQLWNLRSATPLSTAQTIKLSNQKLTWFKKLKKEEKFPTLLLFVMRQLPSMVMRMREQHLFLLDMDECLSVNFNKTVQPYWNFFKVMCKNYL